MPIENRFSVVPGHTKLDFSNKPRFWVPDDPGRRDLIQRVYFNRMLIHVLSVLHSEACHFIHLGQYHQIRYRRGPKWIEVHLGPYKRPTAKNMLVRLSPGAVRADPKTGFLVWFHSSVISRRALVGVLKNHEETREYFRDSVWTGDR